jgi:hypothetical protein
VRLPALSGRDAADDCRSVLDHLLGVERAFGPGKALDDDTGVFINENAHPIAASWIVKERRVRDADAAGSGVAQASAATGFVNGESIADSPGNRNLSCNS